MCFPTRLLPGLAVLVALVMTAVAAADESKKVAILQKWGGKIIDDKLQKESPTTGYLTNEKAFAKLWKAWRPEEKLPEVDFTKEIVLVGTAAGAKNDVTLIPQLNDKGNLAILARGTLVEGPGFCYQIVVIKREGIKTIKGKEIVID